MLQRLVATMLDSAVERWPAELQEDLAQEWAAEVHVLDHEAGVAAPVRRWRQLRFAASLALARPPGADPALWYWLRRTSPAGAHAALLLLAPLLTMLTAVVLLVPLLMIPFGAVQYTPTSTALFSIENYAVEAGLAMLIGTLLARRLLRRRAGRPVGVAACGWAALPVIGGLLAVDLLSRASNRAWGGSGFTAIAAGCLLLLLPPAAAAAAALARRRRAVAIAFAGLAALAVPLLTVHVLTLLAPQTPAAAGTEWWWWFRYLYRAPYLSLVFSSPSGELPIETVLTTLPGFLLATVVLALAHAIRLARPLPSAVDTAPAPAHSHRDVAKAPAIVRSPWWPRIALAGAGYSVLAWATTLAYLTPNIGVQSSWPSRIAPGGRVLPAQPAGWPEWSSEEARLWMHELQLSGIVCAALCLLCAAAYRGRPVLPALAGSAILLAGNMLVVREGWTTPRLLPWLAGGGLVLGAGAWSASRWLASRRPDARPRRLLITVTVLAAFLVPGSFFPRIYVRPEVSVPPVVLLVVVGLPALLTMVAAMGVLATSRRPVRRAAWRLPAGLAVLTAAGGVLYYRNDPIFVPSGENPFGVYLFLAPFTLAVPVAVWTIAAIRGGPATPRRLALHVLLLPLLLAVGYVVARATAMAAMMLARLVLFPMEYGQTYDGVAYVPGAVVLGLLWGYATATWLDRPKRRPAPAPEPVPDGFVDLGQIPPRPA